MSKADKMFYCCPVITVIMVHPGSRILSGSGFAGKFRSEEEEEEGSYGAGSFISGD